MLPYEIRPSCFFILSLSRSGFFKNINKKLNIKLLLKLQIPNKNCNLLSLYSKKVSDRLLFF